MLTWNYVMQRSSYGLGGVLLQKQPAGKMCPAAYTSRSKTKTECRYAQIEKEALATTWALEHWADLLVGMTFRVETDHKPLVPLLSTKLIDELLLCIQRFRMRLINYVIHVPGKFLYTADPCPMPRSIKIRPRVKNSSLK